MAWGQASGGLIEVITPGRRVLTQKHSLRPPNSHEERLDPMRVHLVNPSDNSFGTAVITPRWLFVLAAATPREAGDPILVDESLEPIVPETIQAGDVVGISVHTGNALRGYAVGKMARERGAWVVYGGIHATLFLKKRWSAARGMRWLRATATSPGAEW